MIQLNDTVRKRIQKNPEIDTVLIIGPNGNVGSNLIPELLRMGCKVRALQYRTPVQPRENLEIVQGSTLDSESLKKALDGVDAVCHLIRGSSTDPSDWKKWFDACIQGAVNLLEAAKEFPLKRFIAGSADNVFGHVTIPHPRPITETSMKRFADDYYGLFKIAEESLLEQYHLGFSVPVVITRFGLIWTPDFSQAGAGCVDHDNKKILRKLDVSGRPHVRHDVHMEDAVQGILLAMSKPEAIGENFNILSCSPYSSEVLCDILKEKYGYPIEDLPTDWYSWTADISKAQNVLGYEPQVNVLDTLRK